MARILILEDDPNRIYTFVEKLGSDRHDIRIVTTAEAAIEALRMSYDVIFLDNDLGGTQSLVLDEEETNCGYAVAKWLAHRGRFHQETAIVVHTMNPGAGDAIVHVLKGADFEDVNRIPFPNLNLENLIQEH